MEEEYLGLLGRRDMVGVLLLGGVGWSQEENMSGRKESAVEGAACVLPVRLSDVAGV